MDNTAMRTLITILRGHIVAVRAMNSTKTNPYAQGQIDGIELAIKMAEKLQSPSETGDESKRNSSGS